MDVSPSPTMASKQRHFGHSVITSYLVLTTVSLLCVSPSSVISALGRDPLNSLSNPLFWKGFRLPLGHFHKQTSGHSCDVMGYGGIKVVRVSGCEMEFDLVSLSNSP
jgi:hypothetical protein